MSGGQVICGRPWQMTVTLKVQLVVLPDASVAVQVTTVVPHGNTFAGAVENEHVTTGCGSQLSVAVITGMGTGTGWQFVLTTVMSGGHWITGGVVSRMTTSKQHWVSTMPLEL